MSIPSPALYSSVGSGSGMFAINSPFSFSIIDEPSYLTEMVPVFDFFVMSIASPAT